MINFGTPHRGSLKALTALAGPRRFAGLVDVGRIAREWSSAWELLPQYPCLRAADGTYEKVSERVPGLDPVRLAAAQDFFCAIRTPAEGRTECPYEQQVFFGRVQTTPQFAEVCDGIVRALDPVQDGCRDEGGDGTVPSFASLPIEWDDSASALPLLDKHAAMPMRMSAVQHLIKTLDPMDVSGYKAAEGPEDLDGPAIALEVPAWVREGDRLRVRVLGADAGAVELDVVDHTEGSVSPATAVPTGEEEPRNGILRPVLVADLGTPPGGSYTVVTRTQHPVSDHVLVWSADAARAVSDAPGSDLG